MERQAKRPAVVYAPAPERRWHWDVTPTFGHVYFACSHKRLMARDSAEARYIAGEAEDPFWCPSCRPKRG